MRCLRCQQCVICLLILPGAYTEEIGGVSEETLDLKFPNSIETGRLWELFKVGLNAFLRYDIAMNLQGPESRTCWFE